MTDETAVIFSAIFSWAIVIVALYGAMRVAFRRLRVSWAVGFVFLIAMACAAAATAISSTVFVITSETTVGTPTAGVALVLRGAAALLLLGIIFYYVFPIRIQTWIERKAGLI